MSEDTEPGVEIGRGAKGGYVPNTPLGPPPQGEPLLLAPRGSETAQFRENGYVGVTPLGPPPQGEPLLAQQAPTAPGSQTQTQAQPTAMTQPKTPPTDLTDRRG